MRALLFAAALALAGCASTPPPPPPVVNAAALTVDGVRMDPAGLIDPALLGEALASYARHYGTVRAETRIFDLPGRRIESAVSPIRRDTMSVVDFRIPANRPRWFMIDLRSGGVTAFRVAHGRNSDAAGPMTPLPGRLATHGGVAAASNLLDSNQSAVGAYVAANQYEDGFVPGSVRLHGLDRTNSCAFWRALVMHQARYMTPDPGNGDVGTSDGCLAVEMEQRAAVAGYIRDGGFIYAGPVSLHRPSAADGLTTQLDCEAVRLKPENGPQPPPG
ncbi:MAG: murein L,D-transpeptidase catalytic domain family protein [Micropepsaceae bacterium]